MLSDMFKRLLKFAWFLPGFLLWAAYPPMGERMDVLFALAPLMWLSRREASARESAKRWFQSGSFYWVATLSWMPAIVKNGGPWPLVVLGWFALAAYCALYFAAYGWLSAAYWQWARGGRYGWRLGGVLVVEPVLWCGLELLRSRLFGGFAWNQLGVVPVNSGFGAPAALGGVYLCSAVVLLINGTIAGIVERMWKPERSGFANLRRLGALETVLAFALVFGIYRSSQRPEASRLGYSQPLIPSTSRPFNLSVALIQRNFPCCFQANEENPYAVYGRLLDNVALLKPDLVVLAESALSEFGPVDQQGALRFAQWVAGRTGASLLAGGTRFGDGRTYNSAALYPVVTAPRGESPRVLSTPQPLNPSPPQPLSIYDKVHLVPFGEFIPGDKLIPALQQLAPVGSCTPGELKTLSLSTAAGRLEFGVAICFEDTDSAQMRELAKKGAQVLFFITNDSWFTHSIETEQHAWQAVARAIETGLPVVRVGNSGVSGTITPDGRAAWLLGEDGRPLVDRPGTMFDRIPIGDGAGGARRTAYVKLGDLPLGIAFALLISSMILVKYANNHEDRNQT